MSAGRENTLDKIDDEKRYVSLYRLFNNLNSVNTSQDLERVSPMMLYVYILVVISVLLSNVYHVQGNKCDGCRVHGECKLRNSKWASESPCYSFKCKGKRIKGVLSYEVIPIGKGCIINKTCVRFGKFKDDKNTCTKLRCYKTYERSPALKFFQLGTKVIPRPYGCNYGGKCYGIGKKWTKNCVTRKCVKKKGTAKIIISNIGCRVDGKCVRDGGNWTKQCVTYKCVADNRRADVVIDETGCRVDGKCVRDGGNWTNHCITYKCVADNRKADVVIDEMGCAFGNKCYKNEDTWEHRCNTLHCKLDGIWRMHIDYEKFRCRDGTKCYENNEEWEDGCHKKKCVIGRRKVEIEVSQIGCIYKGKCIRANETVTEECSTYRCVAKAEMKTLVANKQGCKDANGVCHDIGARGFPFEIEGKQYSNCECNSEQGNALVSCRGPRTSGFRRGK